jgi:hypothetical protein
MDKVISLLMRIIMTEAHRRYDISDRVRSLLEPHLPGRA